MNIFRLIKNFISSINKYTEKIAVVILFFLMMLTTIDVIVRFFYKPIPGVYEIVQLGLAVIVFAAIGNSQVTKEHIRIDFFMNFLPIRLQRFNDVIIYTLVLALIGVMFWQLLIYASRMQTLNQITPVLQISIYPAIYIAAIGTLLYMLALFVDLVESIIKVVKGEDTNVI